MDIPDELAEVLRRIMSEDPAERLQSPAEVAPLGQGDPGGPLFPLVHSSTRAQTWFVGISSNWGSWETSGSPSLTS